MKRTKRPSASHFVVRSQSENNDGADFQVALDEQEVKRRRMNKSFCTNDLSFSASTTQSEIRRMRLKETEFIS